ncbi:OLC1v1013144C1 [Oldenlandia corymbosa var. corymbosa]|uniref:OLC1v1013144C1 n=1 Tax=Oldenlandia corymbosa var. corymbosa TaxID=529605 RepID=A0AAV1DXK9_OLDCO|nr:OLC1v1013144C1 [Oldenlandia corymbosa var. corymbosa]
MVRVEEDTGSTTFSGQRHSLGDNTPLAEFQCRQEKKKTGKSYGGEPEKEPAKEHLVLGASQPDPKKQGKTNLPLEKEDIPSPRNTPAAEKRLEDQKLAKIEAELKKLGDDSDQQQRMRRYVLEETRQLQIFGQCEHKNPKPNRTQIITQFGLNDLNFRAKIFGHVNTLILDRIGLQV